MTQGFCGGLQEDVRGPQRIVGGSVRSRAKRCNWAPRTFALRPNGAVDTGFGSRGTLVFPTRIFDASAVALQGDRPIVGGNYRGLCFPCFLILSDRLPADFAILRLVA